MRILQRFSVGALIACATLVHGAAAPSPLTDYAAYARSADALVQAYADSEFFSGVVLVAVDGEPIYRRGFGLANREWNLPADADTTFRIGSMTKQFTAAAILQLAERGKLRLDDRIGKHYAAPAAWEAITVQHLLTHTSGLPEYIRLPRISDTFAKVDHTPEEIVALVRDLPLEFTPGSKFSYNNTGYVLLGYIIEKLSGKSYADYVRDHIFRPLQMDRTGYDVSTAILPRRASGYSIKGAPGPKGYVIENPSYLSMTFPHAAGALYSVVDDLLRWDRALYGTQLLSARSLQAMFTDYGHGYGLGFLIAAENGRRVWSHSGSANGFQSNISRYPDSRLTVVVLANVNAAPGKKIADELAALYFGESPRHVAVPIDPATFERYVGSYRNPAGTLVVILREGGRLFIKPSGPDRPRMELFASSAREFFSKVADLQVTFNGTPPAKATDLIVHMIGKPIPAQRVAESGN